MRTALQHKSGLSRCIRSSVNPTKRMLLFQNLLVENVTVHVNVEAQQAMLSSRGLLVANLTQHTLQGVSATPAVAAQAALEGVSDADRDLWAAWAIEAGVHIPTFPINTGVCDSVSWVGSCLCLTAFLPLLSQMASMLVAVISSFAMS
jgi:hypothetical protein